MRNNYNQKYSKLNYLLTKGTQNHEQLYKYIQRINQPLIINNNNVEEHDIIASSRDFNIIKNKTINNKKNQSQFQIDKILEIAQNKIFKQSTKIFQDIAYLQNQLFKQHKLVQQQSSKLSQRKENYNKIININEQNHHNHHHQSYLNKQIQQINRQFNDLKHINQYLQMNNQDEINNQITLEMVKKQKLQALSQEYQNKIVDGYKRKVKQDQMVLQEIEDIKDQIKSQSNIINSNFINKLHLDLFISHRHQLQSQIDENEDEKTLFYNDLMQFKRKYKDIKKRNIELKSIIKGIKQ